MVWFVVRRLVAAALLVVLAPAVSFVFFALTYTGEPVLSGLGHYLDDTFLHWDFGNSSVGPVGNVLRTGIPVDVAILGGAIVLGVGGGIAAGLAIARRPQSVIARALQGLSPLALSAPAYVTAFATVYLFGSEGGAHPLPFVTDQAVYRPLTSDPAAWLHALWVPWIVVALPLGAGVMRLTASATRDALGGDEVRTARAKGLRERRVLRRHALPLAAPVVSAYAGASWNILILNAAVVESLFNMPGSFRIASRGLENVETPLIQALVFVTVLYVVVGNLIADVLLASLDPRVRRPS